MKKKLALSIAGVTTTLLGGWKLVRQLTDRSAPGGNPGWPPPTPEPEPAPAARRPAPGPEGRISSADESLTKAELYKVATELDISGRSKMSKVELLRAIQDAS